MHMLIESNDGIDRAYPLFGLKGIVSAGVWC